MSFGAQSQDASQQSSSSINPKFMPFAMDALKRAEDVGNQGYTPFMGMDVAVPDSLINSWQGAANRSAAFNTPGQPAQDVRSQMPLTTQDGVQGLSSYAGYQDQLAQLQKNYPGLYDYIKSFSIDPVTGKLGSRGLTHGTNVDGSGGGRNPHGPNGGQYGGGPGSQFGMGEAPPDPYSYQSHGGGGVSVPPWLFAQYGYGKAQQ